MFGWMHMVANWVSGLTQMLIGDVSSFVELFAAIDWADPADENHDDADDDYDAYYDDNDDDHYEWSWSPSDYTEWQESEWVDWDEKDDGPWC